MRRLVDMGVHTMSFITATPFVEGILETLALYRPPVPLVWNTSGYETVETLRHTRSRVVMDIYLPDLKHFSSRMGQLCAKAPDYFEVASAAITEMVRQVGAPQYDEEGIMRQGVLIRHLILPGLTGESIALLDWVHDHLPGIPVSLMRQYVPLNGVDIPGLTRTITPGSTGGCATTCVPWSCPAMSRKLPPPRRTLCPCSGRTKVTLNIQAPGRSCVGCCFAFYALMRARAGGDDLFYHIAESSRPLPRASR